MALIKCTECGQMISDKASKCPNCGCPTQDNLTHGFESAKKSKNGLIWLISILSLSVLLGGGYYFYNKTNGTEGEEVNEIRIDSLLADGHYTFKGNWESSRYSAQPCKLEFEKNGMNLESCAYTNLKYDTRIPLTGTIQNDTLHFVGDISGKQLVITLKIASNGDILIGEGIDYAHSGDKAKLNLTKNVTDNKGKHTEETSKEEMGEQKTSQESLSTSKFVGTSMNNSTDSDYSEEQHYSQTTSTNNKSFNSWGDFCDYFRTTKKYQGRSAYFNGIIEIKTNDSEISVYVGGKYLSSLGLVRQGQEFLFGDYARMAVYVEGRTYPVVVHLPDSQHPYGYFYFEPIATSTNRNLAAALNLPIEKGWMWVEPQIENGKGTLVWHTDCKTKPTPIIYKLIE